MAHTHRRPFNPSVEALETREAPSASPWLVESFDQTAAGALPANWSEWAGPGGSAAVSAGLALSAPNGLAASAATSAAGARVWFNTPAPADAQVSAAVYLNTLIPAQVLARAKNLDTTTPSYYALAVTRGLQVQLLRVDNGVATPLGQVPSATYFSQNWVRATLSVVGTSIQAQVVRPDTGQYLNASGQWQAAPAWVLSVTDAGLAGPGLVGLGRPASYTGTVTFDDFTVVVPDASPPPNAVESFDTAAAGALPAGWAQWASTGAAAFGASSARALSAPNGLAVAAPVSNLGARAWETAPQPADVQVTAALYLNSLIPGQILARGSGLDTAAPSYYALSLTRGLQVELLRVVGGISTSLGKVQSAAWFSDQWVRATLSVSGTELRAQVFRTDTAQYLNASGTWQTAPAWALDLTDAALAGPGLAGLGRPASYTGTLTFDDFRAVPAGSDTQPPSVSIPTPAAGATVAGVTAVQAAVAANGFVARVEFYLDGALKAVATQAPYAWAFDTTTVPDGSHTLAVLAYDLAGNSAGASAAVTVQNGTGGGRPNVPRHYPQIRIAELAYTNTPFGPAEDQILQSGVDLVVTNTPAVSSHIHAVAPNTPQLVYTNYSSLYLDLLTDWLAYADAHGLSREEAFYHVTHATGFSGNSGSSLPVNWFWRVYREGATLGNYTSQARYANAGGVPFAAVGRSVLLGYPERFREINLSLMSGAAGGWGGQWEYVSAVDTAGNPTAWSPLPLLSDTTAGLAASGQVLFDPPADWQPAAVGGSARLYYVRFRTTSPGVNPVAATILGRDYVGANGTNQGVIPAFDSAADADHDGYLNDTEYAHRAAGMDARFAYEGRDFAGYYGQERFASNPADPGFRAWAIDFALRDLAGLPLASGLFVDNSSGVAPVKAADVAEPVASYGTDYGNLLGAVGRAIAPKWILANAGAGGAAADPVIAKVPAYFDEFALRPLSSHYGQFEELAKQLAHWQALTTPAPYLVLDSLPAGGSPTDPRTQLATLAEYYLVADPASTFLDFYGGSAPATSWTQHWSAAAAYNVGQPAGPWSVFATGQDPENPALTYRVYQRPYGNALVLYKPLSYGGGVTGSLSDATATTFALGGTYRPLQADDTLGAAVTSVTLRNGEGAILMKVSS